MQDYQAYYADKTVLITGGAGAIGSNLAAAVGALARSVVILDDLSAGYEWNVPSLPNLLFVKGSVTDETALKRVFGLRPQVVYHLAARVSVPESILYPRDYNSVNVGGTVAMMEAMRDVGVRRVVLASSGAVYGDKGEQPLSETTSPSPRAASARSAASGSASRRRRSGAASGRGKRARA